MKLHSQRITLIVCALAAAVCDADLGLPDPDVEAHQRPIVRGTPTADPAFAAAVFVHGPGFSASGALIAADWVLTAGHVAAEARRLSSRGAEILVRIGGVDVPVLNTAIHPQFSDRSPTRFDIGLLRLAAPIHAVQSLAMFDNAEQNHDFTGEPITLLGFGQPMVGTLQVGVSVALSLDRASGVLALDASAGNAETDLGDSGGPAVIATANGLAILGVHSFGAPGNFSAATVAGTFRAFIDAQTAGAGVWVTRLKPVLAASPLPPLRVDATSSLLRGRGVLPVRFALARDGEPTCDLPPATLVLARRDGAGEPIDERLWSDGRPAQLRVAGCQYLHPLALGALPCGRYAVSVVIGHETVGQATFHLGRSDP